MGHKRQPLTMGFVQVRLEVVAININNIAAVVRAWPTSPNIGSKYISLVQSRAFVRADGILMPHLHKALSLGAINWQTVKSKTFLIILSLFFIQVALGQKISKTDIHKFKIKSISTIDEEGKIKFTEFYNDEGNFIKQGSLNKEQTLQINRP